LNPLFLNSNPLISIVFAILFIQSLFGGLHALGSLQIYKVVPGDIFSPRFIGARVEGGDAYANNLFLGFFVGNTPFWISLQYITTMFKRKLSFIQFLIQLFRSSNLQNKKIGT